MEKISVKNLESQKTDSAPICADSARIGRKWQNDSFMDIQSEINGLANFMNDIGVANPSEFTLEQIPSDFLYLDSIFC